jgi:hypothetical protein
VNNSKLESQPAPKPDADAEDSSKPRWLNADGWNAAAPSVESNTTATESSRPVETIADVDWNEASVGGSAWFGVNPTMRIADVFLLLSSGQERKVSDDECAYCESTIPRRRRTHNRVQLGAVKFLLP